MLMAAWAVADTKERERVFNDVPIHPNALGLTTNYTTRLQLQVDNALRELGSFSAGVVSLMEIPK